MIKKLDDTKVYIIFNPVCTCPEVQNDGCHYSYLRTVMELGKPMCTNCGKEYGYDLVEYEE